MKESSLRSIGGRGKDNIDEGHASKSALFSKITVYESYFFEIIEVIPDWKYL